ncbi:protein Wnt-6-like [Arctopsyche grandis]|uniref:protein Wnt-6-like n=1 Tax=Arctopsyche grandis TaxID=121162 RepID=UPI00406D71A7
MRPALVAACLLFLAPITGSVWATGSHVVMDPWMVCKKARKMRGKLADICRNETELLKQVARGQAKGVKECGYQFRARHWNCTAQRRSMRRILLKDTRETGFVNAITAAGVTYEITRACTAGKLVQCSCDKAKGGGGGGGPIGGLSGNAALPPGDWQWGGCGDNIRYGYRKSRDFMDARYKRRSDIKILIKLHNHNAGRLAIKNYMKPECKCHGLSGSCTLKTCWLKMPTFREVGNKLKDEFDGATKVISSNDGKSFMPEERSIKPPNRANLVYTENSPDFCEANLKIGSLGTQGRHCNATSQGVDGCNLLCCNRGFSQKTVNESVNCRCRFKWCCDVTCDTCIDRRVVNTCH